MDNVPPIPTFVNHHKLCYFNSVLQSLLSVEPIYISILTTPEPVSTCLRTLLESTKSEIAIDIFVTFTELKKMKVFAHFEYDTEHDAPSFGDILLTELCMENKILKLNFRNELTLCYRFRCGHNRVVKEEMNFLSVYLHRACSLQDRINDLEETCLVPFNKYEMCLDCLERMRITQTSVVEYLPNDYVMIEFERIFSIDSVRREFKGSVTITETLAFYQTNYHFVSAVIYKDNHYTAILKRNDEVFYIDDDKIERIGLVEAFEMCALHGRMAVYKRA